MSLIFDNSYAADLVKDSVGNMQTVIGRAVDEKILAQVTLINPLVQHTEDASEAIWSGLYSMQMLQVLSLFKAPRLRFNGNVTDSSATVEGARPDGLLFARGRLVFAREDKRYPNELNEAVQDLRSKHKSFQVHLYGDVTHIFCMATAAERVQFFVRDLRVNERLIAVSEALSLWSDEKVVISALFNIVAWAATVSTCFPTSKILEEGGCVKQDNVFYPNTGTFTTVTLHNTSSPAYVHKKIHVPIEQYMFLKKYVYVDKLDSPPPFSHASSTFVHEADIEADVVKLDLKITPIG